MTNCNYRDNPIITEDKIVSGRSLKDSVLGGSFIMPKGEKEPEVVAYLKK